MTEKVVMMSVASAGTVSWTPLEDFNLDSVIITPEGSAMDMQLTTVKGYVEAFSDQVIEDFILSLYNITSQIFQLNLNYPLLKGLPIFWHVGAHGAICTLLLSRPIPQLLE